MKTRIIVLAGTVALTALLTISGLYGYFKLRYVFALNVTRECYIRDLRYANGRTFEIAETEFKQVLTLLSKVENPEGKAIVRERLVFLAMVMQNTIQAKAVIVKERPADGFDDIKVTAEMIQPYVDTVSEYPEWAKRYDLIHGVFGKESG